MQKAPNWNHLKKKLFYAFLRQRPSPQKMIIFAHMPKAAGISLRETMKMQYGGDKVHEIYPLNKEEALYKLETMPLAEILNKRVITGHEVWNLHQWVPIPFLYITVLRHPVDRVISLYFFIRALPSHRLHQKLTEKNLSIEEFLEWDEGSRGVRNLQARLLAHEHPYEEQNLDVVFHAAKEHLEKYFIVGLTEQYKQSLEMFSQIFHWSNAQETHDNVTTNRPKQIEIAPHIIKKIEELNQVDMAIYESGQKLFKEQQKDLPAVLSQKITR